MVIYDNVILVTGAALRVGRAIALALARDGARIVVHYNRSRKDAFRTVRELESIGTEAYLVQADQTRPADVRRAVAMAVKRFGRIDVLVNSAAIFESTPFQRVTATDWDRHLNANLKGPFFFSQAVAPGMRRRRRGKIINVSDVAGLKPYSGYIPYCAAKAGLLNCTQALAKVLAPHVQVNAICPGSVLWSEHGSATQRRLVTQKTLLKRLGTPEDVAAAVRFLIENDYITGTTIVVDGGRLLY
ncbi:MAG: SDR family oxidoreductase [Deltaproteobacteria bacterium]|nr:SDR family oxidoreductase [Deltaproteobacteria bacterium]